MLSAWIDDGYTETGRLEAIPRLMPELTFTFRPMTRDELAGFAAQHKNADEKAYARGVAERLAVKITQWSLTKPDGTAVPVTADNLLRLKNIPFQRLHEIVFGHAVTDEEKREADAKNS